jgi:hypothetical protein
LQNEPGLWSKGSLFHQGTPDFGFQSNAVQAAFSIVWRTKKGNKKVNNKIQKHTFDFEKELLSCD